MKWILSFFLISILVSSCIYSDVYEKNATMSGFRWDEKDIKTFTFHISDTSAAYNMYFTMRHTEAYPFANIWLNIGTRTPGTDSITSTRVEIPLADLEGKWLGRGKKEEIWEHRMPITATPVRFTMTGDYTVKLQHIMRVNPLPEVLSVGIRVEKQGASK